MFTDKVILQVKAGNGGNGLLSFRHERFVAKGGPDGGDGGDGGSIIAKTDHNLNTLAEYRYKKKIIAKNGEAGKKAKCHGRNGADVYLRVPVGTIIYDNDKIITDLTELDQAVVVAQGGKGGFGNAHFISSRRQTPRVAELGESGEERIITLELKLLADVGLVGLPNAGKSTLLSVVSNAKPEIADYPFTTLTPHLGVVDINNYTILMADIPGLIEGASSGKGLGDEFLRHVERTAVLLHLIDSTSNQVAADYSTIQTELRNYKVDLSKRPQIIVLTKIDAISDKELAAKQTAIAKLSKAPQIAISAVKKTNIFPLLSKTLVILKQERKRAKAKKPKPAIPIISVKDDPNLWWVEKSGQVFVIKGQKIERFAMRTDQKNETAMQRLRDILHRLGIDRELIRMSIKADDLVQIGRLKFKW